MTYPVSGPGSAQLERLDGVPHDGGWRSTTEMNRLLGYAETADISALRTLEAGGVVESRPCECGGATYWRRTDA